jgi:hypothetical protein
MVFLCLDTSVSLILFIDGAPFSDAHNGSIWDIFGFITNFPPRLRARFSNILKIYFINGRIFSFNGIYEKQMDKSIRKPSRSVAFSMIVPCARPMSYRILFNILSIMGK